MTDAKNMSLSALVLIVLTLVGGVISAVGYLQDDPTVDNARVYMSTDGGAVLFEHARHAVRADACLDCHHDLAGEAFSCQDCHDDDDYEPDMADHADLVEIHENECTNCHEIAPDDEAVGCRECHADAIADVYHRSCSECHLAVAPDRFADTAGEPLCASCHLR